MNKQTHRSTPRMFALTAFALLGLLAASPTACAMNIRVGEEVPDGGAPSVSFVAPADASVDDAVSVAPLFECVVTECPAGTTTCPGRVPSLGREYFRCETNLLTDNLNCGACGNACPNFEALATKTACVDGKCVATCDILSGRQDCNGVPDDGCEVDLKADRLNCGACGNVCAPGVPCLEGKCGCSPPLILCGDTCVDPTSDPLHCGGCDNACSVPEGAPSPDLSLHMNYTCVAGVCGKVDCFRASYAYYTDCNGDKGQWRTPGASDGCETNLGVADNANCGGCGIACAPGQRCGIVDGSFPPVFECICKPNETKCGEEIGLGEDSFLCADLLTDTKNCGACGYQCPEQYKSRPRRTLECRQGTCISECTLGWGECNGIDQDGCETNLLSDPTNCGACGNRCDVAAGQPCVGGHCLTKPCDVDGGIVQ